MYDYDYMDSMCEDIRNYIEENCSDILDDYTIDDAADKLYDELWDNDDITGNGGGSYFVTAEEAEEALLGNRELLIDALEEFGDSTESYKTAIRNPHYADTTIRCAMLMGAIVATLRNYSANHCKD